MSEISIKEMLDVGAHFGHQTRRWNPKMKPFIYGAHSGIHILDLQQTYHLIQKAVRIVEEVVGNGDSVLFVGTKKQAQSVIEEEAKRSAMPYVTRRWLGGMLTNFSTIRRSVDRLLDLEARREKNDLAGYTKKERLDIDRDITKLEIALGGIKNMRRLPGAIFVVDPNIEGIAIHEANVLNIPVIAITDSNCDPDPVDYVIPANDDAQRCIQMFASRIADACLRGMQKRESLAREDDTTRDANKKKAGRKAQAVEGPGKAYVSKADVFEDKNAVESFSAMVTPETPTPETPVEPAEGKE